MTNTKQTRNNETMHVDVSTETAACEQATYNKQEDNPAKEVKKPRKGEKRMLNNEKKTNNDTQLVAVPTEAAVCEQVTHNNQKDDPTKELAKWRKGIRSCKTEGILYTFCEEVYSKAETMDEKRLFLYSELLKKKIAGWTGAKELLTVLPFVLTIMSFMLNFASKFFPDVQADIDTVLLNFGSLTTMLIVLFVIYAISLNVSMIMIKYYTLLLNIIEEVRKKKQ